MKKTPKTNAVRFLEKNRIPHHEIVYESNGFLDGLSIAQKLGQPPERTFKTLVTVGKSKSHYVFVLPVHLELNLKKAAALVKEKSVEMIPIKDITAVTGYVRGGCSPLGMKKQFPTVLDQSALQFETIFFSAGRLGAQLELDPRLLPDLIPATFGDLV